jgi:thiol-disulfide isomerase/thioredoxin
LDVRNESSIGALENLIITGPLTLVLVYADWCGHCTRFKENMWNKASNMPNKTINTASVHYDMMDKTSLKNSKIEGYPSLLLVGTDKKPADFRDEATGAKINAMPMPESPAELESILSTPVTESIRNANSFAKNLSKSIAEPSLSASAAAVEEEPVPTPMPTPMVAHMVAPMPTPMTQKNAYRPTSADMLGTPPNTLTDLVETQTRNKALTQQAKQAGGSLLSSLLEITSKAAPSVILTAAAYASLKKSKSRKIKRGGKRGNTKQRATTKRR